MAIAIKDTPVLTGKDAERFSNEIKESATKAISKEELEKMEENYKTFKTLEAQSPK